MLPIQWLCVVSHPFRFAFCEEVEGTNWWELSHEALLGHEMRLAIDDQSLGRGRRLLLDETEPPAADHLASGWQHLLHCGMTVTSHDAWVCKLHFLWLPLLLWMLMGQMEWRMAEFFKCKRSLVLGSIGMQARDRLWIRAKNLAVDKMWILINWIGNHRMKDLWNEKASILNNRFYLG